MDDKIEFRNLKELYDRVKPALYSKYKEMKRLGLSYVTEKDIWNYLAEKKWKDKTNLELHELISDILHTDNYEINDYVLEKLNKIKNKDSSVINIDGLI